MAVAERLAQMKAKIDKAKERRQRLEGQRDQLLVDLEKLGCKSIKHANTQIGKLDKEITTLNSNVTDGLKTLEESYAW